MERTKEYEKLVIENYNVLLTYAKSLTKNFSKAEDLVQEVMIKALNKHDNFQEGTNIKAWLFTVMRNEYLSGLRKTKREKEDPDGIFASLVAVPEAQDYAYDLKIVQKRMRLAPKAMRMSFELVVLNGMQYDEAAQILSTHVGTVKSRVSRMRQFLETGIQPIEEQEEKQTYSDDLVFDIHYNYIKGLSVYQIAEHLNIQPSEVMLILAQKRIRKRSTITLFDYSEDFESEAA